MNVPHVKKGEYLLNIEKSRAKVMGNREANDGKRSVPCTSENLTVVPKSEKQTTWSSGNVRDLKKQNHREKRVPFGNLEGLLNQLSRRFFHSWRPTKSIQSTSQCFFHMWFCYYSTVISNNFVLNLVYTYHYTRMQG